MGERDLDSETQSSIESPNLGSFEKELEYISLNSEIAYYWDFGPAGLKTFAKRIVRKLIKCVIPPILQKQNALNHHIAECLRQIPLLISYFRSEFEKLFRRTDALQAENRALRAELEKTRAESMARFTRMEDALSQYEERLRQIESESAARSAHVENVLSRHGERLDGVLERLEREDGKNVYTALDYFKFQEQFRGSEEMIMERQRKYIPFFQNCEGAVLDLGFGRGEFLRLMRENGIPAKGVDLYAEYVEMAERQGLDVCRADGIAYLRDTEEQFGGIFCSQVIEHINFADLQSLCFSACQKLAPGGYLVLETPNLTSLSMFTSNFYVDPTHIKPIHPMMLQYLLREAGFRDTQLIFTDTLGGEPLPKIEGDGIRNLDEINAAIGRVSDLLYGSLDYAVAARK